MHLAATILTLSLILGFLCVSIILICKVERKLRKYHPPQEILEILSGYIFFVVVTIAGWLWLYEYILAEMYKVAGFLHWLILIVPGWNL